MALPTLTLEINSFASDGSTVTLGDTTTFTGSDYNRNEVALYIKIYKLDKNGIKETKSVTSYDPETVSQFIFEHSQDGWHQAYYVAIPVYSPSTSYYKNNVVYNTSDNTVYKVLVNGPITGVTPTPGSNYSVVSDPATLIDNEGTSSESSNLIWTIFEFISTPYTRIYAGTAAVAAAKKCCGDCQRAEEVLDYEFYYVQLDAMVVANDRGYYSEGEKIARSVQEQFEKTC